MQFRYHFFNFLLLLSCSVHLHSQSLADFENISLAPASFLNGSQGETAFGSGDIELAVVYTPQFDSWSGWAISSVQDATTPGFGNQYASASGSGNAASANYAVSYAPNGSVLRLTNPGIVEELYLNNSTYGRLSMLEGDAFSKRFGGETGDDPDFFLLTIKGYTDGLLSNDSINFYLADFRFADNTQDYILADWTPLTISNLGVVDSLLFTLSSSDVGDFGMNTPAYFCLDDVRTNLLVSNSEAAAIPSPITIYPNPATDWIFIQSSVAMEAQPYWVFDMMGRLQASGIHQGQIPVSSWPKGTYLLVLQTSHGVVHRRVQR